MLLAYSLEGRDSAVAVAEEAEYHIARVAFVQAVVASFVAGYMVAAAVAAAAVAAAELGKEEVDLGGSVSTCWYYCTQEAL